MKLRAIYESAIPRRVETGGSRAAGSAPLGGSFLPAVFLLVAGIWTGCATSTTQPQIGPQFDRSPPASTVASEARLDGSEAEIPGEGPVEHRLPGEDMVFPPAPPEGIIGIAVPAIVSEPAAVYQTPPGEVPPEELVMTEIPRPRRREPRPMARVGTESGEVASEATGTGADLGLEKSAARAPALTASFDSLDFDGNSPNTGGSVFIPPDPIAAAGPDHLVNVVNVSIQFHTKDGTPLLDSVAGAPVTGVSLASFFAPLSPVNFTFDPKVIYDQHAGRFVVVTLELQDVVLGDPADTSRILVAVSDDSDPNGTWYFTAINSKVMISAVDHWADYPGLAIDEEAVYITANMFSFLTSGGAPGGNRLWVIDKFTGAGGGFYGGGTATVSLFDPVPLGGFSATTQPAHVFGAAPASPNVGTWLTLFNGLTNGFDEFLQVVRVDDPVGPGATTFVGPTFINMGNIDDNAAVLPDAPQLGSAETIETNDRRTLHSVWRDNRLYVTTTIDPEAGDPNDGEATAHWVQMNTFGGGGVALADQGDIGGEDIADDTHTFYPSIAVNDSGDVAVGFAASAATIYPSALFATRAASDTPGINTGSVMLRAGLDYYVRTFDSPPCSTPAVDNRWGDYSGAAVDPFDECFWVYNQYSLARGTGTTGGCNGRPATEDGRWGTAHGYFCVSCATNLVLSSLTVSGTESHEARDTLTASTVTVGATGDLTLTSDTIGLETSFKVEVGGQLTIVNGPCL